MSERLRPDDMAFLVTESASTPMHNATLEIFEPPASGFDYDRLVALVGDRIAFVPRYRQRLRRSRAAGQPGVGRRRGLRPDLPRTTLRTAAPGLDRPAPGPDRPDPVPPARPAPPAVGDVLHRGPRGRPLRDPVEVAPDPGRRGGDHRPGPGDPRRRPGAARRRVHVAWHPHHVPSARAWSGRRPRLGARPAAGHGHPVRQRRQRASHRDRRRRCGRPEGRRARCPPAGRLRSRRSTPRSPSSAGS